MKLWRRQARAGEIALCATATEEWDDHILSLADLSGLRVHFPHGVTCLSSRDGQRCAALADILLNGLTQTRVRRLLALDSLPLGWLSVPRGATLASSVEWKRALDVFHGEGSACHAVVLPLLAILERGSPAAAEAAASFLRGRSRTLWEIATRAAPVEALEITLRTTRIADGYDPATCKTWRKLTPPDWLELLLRSDIVLMLLHFWIWKSVLVWQSRKTAQLS